MPPVWGLVTMYIFSLLLNVNLIIVVPTAPHYVVALGGKTSFSGIVVGAMAAAQLVCAYPFYLILQKYSFKTILLVVTFVGGIGGNVLYALAPLTHSKWTLVLARVLIGPAVYPFQFEYVCAKVGIKHRGHVMLLVGAFMSAGMVLAFVLALLILSICDVAHCNSQLINPNTLPGWVMAGISAAFFLFTLVALEPGVVSHHPAVRREEEVPLVASTDSPRGGEDTPWSAVIFLIILVGISTSIVQLHLLQPITIKPPFFDHYTSAPLV